MLHGLPGLIDAADQAGAAPTVVFVNDATIVVAIDNLTALRPTVVRARRARAPKYGQAVMAALRMVWAVMDAPASKRMAPFLPEIVARLRACGELQISDETASLLVGMSAATIDSRLAGERARLRLKGRSA